MSKQKDIKKVPTEPKNIKVKGRPISTIKPYNESYTLSIYGKPDWTWLFFITWDEGVVIMQFRSNMFENYNERNATKLKDFVRNGNPNKEYPGLAKYEEKYKKVSQKNQPVWVIVTPEGPTNHVERYGAAIDDIHNTLGKLFPQSSSYISTGSINIPITRQVYWHTEFDDRRATSGLQEMGIYFRYIHKINSYDQLRFNVRDTWRKQWRKQIPMQKPAKGRSRDKQSESGQPRAKRPRLDPDIPQESTHGEYSQEQPSSADEDDEDDEEQLSSADEKQLLEKELLTEEFDRLENEAWGKKPSKKK